MFDVVHLVLRFQERLDCLNRTLDGFWDEIDILRFLRVVRSNRGDACVTRVSFAGCTYDDGL